MAACYAPDATFRDPVFGERTGRVLGAMWRMLTGRAPATSAWKSSSNDAGESEGSARWIARYTFSQAIR